MNAGPLGSDAGPRTVLAGVAVRRMRDDDYDAAWRAILGGGWGDRRASLQLYLRLARAALFVAEAGDGSIVGTSTAIQHGTTGWIGLVFVAPAWRGRGLGRSLTEAALQQLLAMGCASVLLAATPLGRPIYDRLGFQPGDAYTILSGHLRRSGEPPPPAAPTPEASTHQPGQAETLAGVRPLTGEDVAGVCQLDRELSGEERGAVLEALLAGGAQGWVVGSPDEIRGYALRTPVSLGPVVAPSSADARALLDTVLAQATATGTQPVSLTVPTSNLEARAYLRSHGLEEQREVPRMVFGEAVAWRPSAMWAIINFALG